VIERTLQSHFLELAGRYPVLTLTGPRQSGKTTLSRMAFPDKDYVSLENPAQREFATDDPVGFLARYGEGAIFDEVQRTPELTSYLQGLVDEDPRPGRFVLTGSQNLVLMSAISQSLAGRTALLELLPLDLAELRRFRQPPTDLFEIMWSGGYPRIHERRLPAYEWLTDYAATYVERDVRQLVNVGDLVLFQTFLRLCAGRTGQLLNLASLAGDCGISPATAKSWLSVLEASYVLFRLPPFYTNLSKRLIKTPKLYFYPGRDQGGPDALGVVFLGLRAVRRARKDERRALALAGGRTARRLRGQRDPGAKARQTPLVVRARRARLDVSSLATSRASLEKMWLSIRQSRMSSSIARSHDGLLGDGREGVHPHGLPALRPSNKLLDCSCRQTRTRDHT